MFTEPLLLLVALFAQVAPVEPTIEEIRTTARTMLEPMCGTQCDVIDVKVKHKRASPVGAVAPGFDETPANRMVAGEIRNAVRASSDASASVTSRIMAS